MKKVITLIIVLAILIIGGGVGGAYYFIEVANYISTDDAKIQGNLVTVNSSISGRLVSWPIKEGDTVKKGDLMGTLEVTPAHGTTPTVISEITAPREGTVLQTGAIANQLVSPGISLAMIADLTKLFIIANVLETDLANIKLGNRVHVTVDAFKGDSFDGIVDHIGLATNSTFSMLPASNAGGNYTKVVQRVPVYISLNSYAGKRLIPGLNATVKIER